jgi:hypothetical protein
MHVLGHGDGKLDLVQESLGEVPADDNPIALSGELSVLLRQDGLSDAAKPRDANVPLVFWKVSQVLPKPLELLFPVCQVGRGLPTPGRYGFSAAK